jgi:hypothetical protein
LASLLKTAEELKVKGLAEVSWRTEEAQQTATVAKTEEEDEPGNKRRRMVSSPAFRPRVTNVMGGVSAMGKHNAANFLDISMVSLVLILIYEMLILILCSNKMRIMELAWVKTLDLTMKLSNRTEWTWRIQCRAMDPTVALWI